VYSGVLTLGGSGVVAVLVVRTMGGRVRSLGMSARRLGIGLRRTDYQGTWPQLSEPRTIGQEGFRKTRCTAKKPHFIGISLANQAVMSNG
jgi:hypothetical protein